jgi:hypothetical protein
VVAGISNQERDDFFMRTPILMCTMLLMTCSTADAQLNPDDEHGVHDHHDMEEVVVRATPLQRNLEEMSQSATVIAGSALAREASASLGDTLTHVRSARIMPCRSNHSWPIR